MSVSQAFHKIQLNMCNPSINWALLPTRRALNKNRKGKRNFIKKNRKGKRKTKKKERENSHNLYCIYYCMYLLCFLPI